MIYIIFIAFALISFAVQKSLQHRFEKYSKVPLPYGLTGRDIAQRMLQENGINDVTITQIDGTLTDHYNPTNHTINLSRGVYDGNSIAAAPLPPTKQATPCSMPRPMLRYACVRL